MSEVQSLQSEVKDLSDDNLFAVDGELLEDSESGNTDLTETKGKRLKTNNQKSENKGQIQYIFLPLIFLTVALLGGLRLNAADNAFVFLKPALVCLVFASILLILFFRAKLLRLDGWFSESFSTLKNAANAAVLIALFAASTQIFNALLPERGLPFWVVAFCFFWTLWNNLFAEFDTKRLLKSLGGLFGLAFVLKYLVLANLAAPENASWWQTLTENPAQTALTWFLDLPRYAAGTGYIQFFTVIFYLVGLFLTKAETTTKIRV